VQHNQLMEQLRRLRQCRARIAENMLSSYHCPKTTFETHSQASNRTLASCLQDGQEEIGVYTAHVVVFRQYLCKAASLPAGCCERPPAVLQNPLQTRSKGRASDSNFRDESPGGGKALGLRHGEGRILGEPAHAPRLLLLLVGRLGSGTTPALLASDLGDDGQAGLAALDLGQGVGLGRAGASGVG